MQFLHRIIQTKEKNVYLTDVNSNGLYYNQTYSKS